MTNLCNILVEGFIKETYEDNLPKEADGSKTGLIVYAYGNPNDPTLAWGRASANPRGYGMANYNDLKKVRDLGGDVSHIIIKKEKNKNGYDDGIIDLIRAQKGLIWVHSFIPTKSIRNAIDIKEMMYEQGDFDAKVMRYQDPSRAELNIV
jgi:hypothetical protein